jgi:5-methyltetrahydropteroyltriglutamate--homocysteine methyltransferase
LTTHAGSLVRPPEVRDLVQAVVATRPVDATIHDRRLAAAVKEVVAQQAGLGLDIVSDGEYGKSSCDRYIRARLSGLERRAWDGADLEELSPGFMSRDQLAFTEFYELHPPIQTRPEVWVCAGPISYSGHAALQTDIANLKAAIGDSDVVDGFLPAVAPGTAVANHRNEFYASDEECAYAYAEALREEYRAIVEAGLILQIDDPRLVTQYDTMLAQGRSVRDYRRWARLQVDALNSALRDLPEERTRYHVCWGSWHGPHVGDVPLREVVDVILQARVGAYVLEASNVRHEHEWQVWDEIALPEGRKLIPGVISHATKLVEHPRLVADRLLRFARVVGPESVIAGTDCGFAQTAYSQNVHPTIMWAKLRSLVDGAQLATNELRAGRGGRLGWARTPTAKNPSRAPSESHRPGLQSPSTDRPI